MKQIINQKVLVMPTLQGNSHGFDILILDKQLKEINVQILEHKLDC